MALKEIDTKQRWYYDACVLDHEKYKEIYSEIINKDDLRINYVSHLSIGEAYGRCLSKGEEQAAAFISLINTLKDYIRIIGNDARPDIFNKVREKYTCLRLCDAVHLSTAIGYRCHILKTNDHNLWCLKAKEIADISEELSRTKLIIKKL